MQSCLASTVLVFCCAMYTAIWGCPARSCLALTLNLLSTTEQDPKTEFYITSAHSFLDCSEKLDAYTPKHDYSWDFGSLTSPLCPKQFYPDKQQTCLTNCAFFPAFLLESWEVTPGIFFFLLF